MKLHSLEHPTGRNSTQNPPKLLLLSTTCLVLFTIIPIYYPLPIPSILWSTLKTSSPSSPNDPITLESSHRTCDIFTGEWVPNPSAPYYTNTTCWAIHNHQNCMKHGRPDSDFLKWRWKPDDCDLPIFNPAQFLELVRGKSLAFVGDSVGRNQMQSLICLLSRVEYPIDVSYTPDEMATRWFYTSYNFTLTNFWSPFLVKSKESDPTGPASTGLFDLYLDEFDTDWTTQIDEFDYIIISAGHWFFRSAMYYESGEITGCHYCLTSNITEMGRYYGYRMAFKTAFRAINAMESFKGITFLRTFAPEHFENGLWNEGGNCVRKRPFLSNETRLEGVALEFYMTQVEEFRIAEREGRERGLKFRLLDTTQAMLLRPDGHPGPYGHEQGEKVTMSNDCLHWCLPGPIDAWNDMLLEMLKMEGGAGLVDNGLYRKDRKLKNM